MSVLAVPKMTQAAATHKATPHKMLYVDLPAVFDMLLLTATDCAAAPIPNEVKITDIEKITAKKRYFSPIPFVM